MNTLYELISLPLGTLMRLCYQLVHNYGLAIIVFTLLTKVILFPLTIMIQKNSIKMIKLQPELNMIAASYPDNPDKASEEQLKLYKRENYRPLAGLIPMMIQIPLVLGVMRVIYNPLQHILKLPADVISVLTEHTMLLLNLTEAGGSIQVSIINLIQNPEYVDSFRSLSPRGMEITDVIQRIQQFDMYFCGINLSAVPDLHIWNLLLLVPLIAGASSALLCICQNRVNVLQREQGFWGKWGMAVFLVLFSLYFGLIVPAGVGIYWSASNLFAIVVMYVVNWLYKPKNYIDYEALEQSKAALTESRELAKKTKLSREDRQRAKADYRAFCKDETKEIIFYSEKSGFYKYFKHVIEYILEHSDIIIHYVTSDPRDAIFQMKHLQIKPYFIDNNRLIPLFMKVDSDIMVMTTPDLDNFHLKRSYVKKDVEYIYMPHGLLSTNMVINKGAYDHFDTIFCVGPHQIEELRESEAMYDLPPKKMVECGYGLFDDMLADYRNSVIAEHAQKKILIAPSWQEDNILESCLDEVIEQLKDTGCLITVRPHPEFIKRFAGKMNRIVSKYGDHQIPDVVLQMDFSSNSTVFEADLLITDWSGIAYEFSYVTKKPCLFINTRMKVLNEDYDKYKAKPLDLSLRDKIGISLDTDQLSSVKEAANQLLNVRGQAYAEAIQRLVETYVFHIGESGKYGGRYMVERILEERRKHSI
jgi:YidC/Oxa1 family membrane protein insertase